MSKRLIWIGVVSIVVISAGILWFSPASRSASASAASAEFTQLMTRGNGLLEKGDATAAIAVYAEALKLSPQSTDVRLNLANAYLLADRPADVIATARQVLELDPNSAAAHYLIGCAYLRQNQPEPAAQALQQAWKIDPTVPAVDFQMGMAQKELGQIPDAIRDFENVVRAEPDHPSAHYQLSQLYRRVGRNEDATRALQQHQRVLARINSASITVAALERSKYTQPLAPFVLAQPDGAGIPVRFTDATAETFGASAADYAGPMAVIDYERDGRWSVFAQQKAGGFALLDNRAGKFSLLGRPLRTPADAAYRVALTGDVDNDDLDDVVVLGEQDSRLFKFYPQGRVRDATRAAGLDELKASAGVLADLDFSGNLDLLVVAPRSAGIAAYRNLGNLFFDPSWPDTGLPSTLAQATQVITEDWNNDGLPGVFVARAGASPVYLAKQRAAAYAAGTLTDAWPAGAALATGDLDNDLRPEAVIATESNIEIVARAQAAAGPANATTGAGDPALQRSSRTLPLNGFAVSRLVLADYDNDGWLDLVAHGSGGVRVWRNAGQAGFHDVTKTLGLEAVGALNDLAAADFDGDGDTDFVTASDSGLRFWRNDGGNQNRQFTLRLDGNRSNSSALGVRVELTAGNWRTSRTVRRNPLEIGVGQHAQLDALRVRWFDLSTAQVDVPVARAVYTVAEPTLPTGSCPYLYAWDGTKFAFLTDILGAAPLGLPANEKLFVSADPEELLALGDATTFPPRDGAYEVRITDELREVLYLDEAHLIAVDHPVGTVVHPTSKMLPGPPFPQHELWTLRPLATPQHAARNDGLDVTAALAQIDRQMASPVQLRRPQLRGLAEPFSVTLDFGALDVTRPLVLALTGWIHFGGGMANISGSIDPTLPFPFPTLEAQRADGSWQKVDVVVGTPAGKTKTILVDLENKLAPGTQRLRLATAYEIHWDRVQLCEKLGAAQSVRVVAGLGEPGPGSATPATVEPRSKGGTPVPRLETREYRFKADRSELRWRGYGRFADLPPYLPRSPVYDDVSPVPPWDRTPSGWFTRYGPVDDLIAARDDRLALLAGGDELALSFDAARVPPPAPGMQRAYFLHVVGWDKDADFHVEQGWRLEPFPWNGMNDQTYGQAPRPAHLDDAWIKEYNTRWVGPRILSPGGRQHATP